MTRQTTDHAVRNHNRVRTAFDGRVVRDAGAERWGRAWMEARGIIGPRRPARLRIRWAMVALYVAFVASTVLVLVAPGGARELLSPLVPIEALAIYCARRGLSTNERSA